MKLKRLELELADNLTRLEVRKGRDVPFLKRWRVWCNGVCIGDIIKHSDGTFSHWVYKCDIGDIYQYVRTEVEGKPKYTFNPKGKDPRKRHGFKTLKEVMKDFQVTFKNNLKHILE